MSRRRANPLAALSAVCLSLAANVSASSTIFVARRGWHIDIGLAAADLAPPLIQSAQTLANSHYVFFGFADKHYLLAKNHNAPVLLAALFPGSSVMLVSGLKNSPAQAFGDAHVVPLNVSVKQMEALQSFIWRSLRTQDATLKVYQQGPYEDSVYFLAAAKYSAFHTCNTWGAEALRAAGLPVHAAGVIFASQLWTQARRLQAEVASSTTPKASLLSVPH